MQESAKSNGKIAQYMSKFIIVIIISQINPKNQNVNNWHGHL